MKPIDPADIRYDRELHDAELRRASAVELRKILGEHFRRVVAPAAGPGPGASLGDWPAARAEDRHRHRAGLATRQARQQAGGADGHRNRRPRRLGAGHPAAGAARVPSGLLRPRANRLGSFSGFCRGREVIQFTKTASFSGLEY